MYKVLTILCHAVVEKIYSLMIFGRSAASVGIIGGADGPTAIFVADGTTPWLETALCVLFVLGVAGFLVWNRCRKK